MPPRVTAAAILSAAVLAVTGLLLSVEPEPLAAAEVLDIVEPSKRVALTDGGAVYVVQIRVADGGEESRSIAPDCARRRTGAACMRLDGTPPGDWNRYPAALLVGDCERVACSLYAGEEDSHD